MDEAMQKDGLASMIEYFNTNMMDCKIVKKGLYWIDILLSGIAAWGLFYLAATVTNIFLSLAILTFSTIFFYRGLSFTHEVTHHAHQIPGFRIAWDILFGIPFLFPSYFYHTHLEHHRTDSYGTAADPEYLILKFKIKDLIFAFWIGVFIPLTLVYRSLLFPFAIFTKKIKRYYENQLSHFYINSEYKGHPLAENVRRGLYKEDLFCSLFLYVALVLAGLQILPAFVYGYWYIVIVIASILNNIRFIICTHGYRNLDKKTRSEQIADSFTLIPDSLFSTIIAPVGLRFHALHHLLPAVPYHSLRRAHLELVQKFPDNAIYNSTFVTDPLQRMEQYMH